MAILWAHQVPTQSVNYAKLPFPTAKSATLAPSALAARVATTLRQTPSPVSSVPLLSPAASSAIVLALPVLTACLGTT